MTIGLLFSGLILSSVTVYATTESSLPYGLRLVGRAVDGAIVLDGTDSGLTDWEIAATLKRTNKTHSSASELVAIGTIDSIDQINNSLTVAGQTISITENTQLVDELNGSSHPLNLVSDVHLGLSIGRHVAIAGNIVGIGQSTAEFIVTMPAAAAPGTSLIYVRGVLQEIDPITQRRAIGNLKLNFNLATYESTDLLPGNVVEIVGYHAGPRQLEVIGFSNLTLPEPVATSTARLKGIHGSGLKGIHGSGLKGIHGSGLKGIHGSGLKGIHGSGLKGIHGSGLKGIHGSGLKGIHGSGLKGIHGSGLKGI